MESQTDEPQDSEYKIITYQATDLPQEYRNLIIGPFLNSLRYGNDLFKIIDKESYYLNYARYIELLLKREHSQIRLATLNDDTVLGWCLRENKAVHYVWVKKEVRRQGICRSLLPKDFETITHITNKGLNIWVNNYSHARFDPFV